ncbi:MAG: ErfK/YbiS/YcfS/YnhG family protein [uncultured bacterium]|nr:MAG: ErfK/YbiS/YcfS/YnhG family protein [uncultured bacterium]
MAKVGITFPPVPFPGINPPVELNNIPFSYAKVTNDEVPLYTTIDDAIANNPSGKLASSRIKYVSLIQKVSTEKGIFYQTSMSKWISAEVITKVGVQSFQGFLFKRNPQVPFGWILSETTSRKGPGYAFSETGKTYTRFNIINIYDLKTDKEIEWVMVGPDEWIDHRYVARVTPNYDKPSGVESDRWIEVNLYEQVLIVHEKDRIVFATLISSGVDPFFTQPGVFKIYKRLENQYMQGAFEADRSDYYYLEDVPFIQYFDQARALHGAYWNTLFGYQRSHGCVNLSVADAHWVFDWAKDGDYVYVWDPSGKTPTDPSFYGAGGA